MKRMNRLISFVIAILVFTTSMYSNTFVKSDANTNLKGHGVVVMAAEDLRVTTASLNLRSGPGTSYSILSVMPKGATVSVLSVSGSWARVVYNGITGYASTAYLAPATTTTMYTTANLNMRTGPGTTYSIIRVIPKGAAVTVLSISGGWARVSYGGSTGYSSMTYLTSSVTSNDIRITTDELNLRSGPGTTYSIIAVMPKGSKVTVLSVSGSWARVIYNGKTGYAHTGYLVKEGTAPSIAISKGIVTSTSKQIALTFDAGWEYSTTLALLNMLDTYGVKATFFLRAYWVRDNQALAKEIQSRGHSIQNHSLTHPHMNTMTESQIRTEFTESTKIFQSVLGITPTLFRPPFGEYNSTVLKVAGETGYKYTVLWSIDTIDWAITSGGITITKDTIADKVINNVTDRDIVLMHIAYQKTVDALPKMIENLKSRGYVFKTVPQMVP